MDDIDLSAHPFLAVQRIVRLVNARAVLNFSIYQYSPQQVHDERRVFKLRDDELTEKWLLETLEALKPDEELALNSNIRIGGEDLHIPMIDFAGIGSDHLAGLTPVFGPRVAEEFDFYASGRSFHAYGRIGLMSHMGWINFMGRLLLCNLRDRPTIIDQRWVGHRLIGGYSALRWSKNSMRHRSYPILVERIEDLDGLTRREKLGKLGL